MKDRQQREAGILGKLKGCTGHKAQAPRSANGTSGNRYVLEINTGCSEEGQEGECGRELGTESHTPTPEPGPRKQSLTWLLWLLALQPCSSL